MSQQNPSRKPFLSPARRQLIELMREVGYGRIRGLTIRDGEPVLTPRPRVVRSHKFGGDHGRATAPPNGPTLKQAHIDLFQLFDEVGDGVIDELTVTNGLPLHAERAV